MAFFRKTKKQEIKPRPSRETPTPAQNQEKWDALERLVSEPLSDTAETESLASPPLDLDLEFLQDSNTRDLTSNLNVDLPDGLDTLDVTPEAPKPTLTEKVAAMAPSAHFKDGVRAERTSLSNISASQNSDNNDNGTETFISSPPPLNRPDRADIGAMRLDVARISADIQSGEELYRRAQQRIENLTGFVERAEIDFSMLNRLEPENRRLKARNRTIEREIAALTQKMSVLRADVEDREQRLTEKTRVYETTLGKLSVAQKSLQEYERALGNSRESSDRNALNAERLQTSLDVERRENEVLRTRVTETSSEIDIKQTAYIEAKKIADSLAQDCSDYRHQAETIEKEADSLRQNLATAQTQNNAMKAEMLSLHEDIRRFKSQSEFTIISREDEMTALQQQVDHLTKQLNIKDEIVQNAARDVQELRKIRTAQDLERERLEAQVESQAYQLDQANSALLQSKQDVTDFDRRYRDVATALSVAQARRMSNEPAETPDIQPLNAPEDAHITTARLVTPETASRDDFEDLTGEEIQERIMDFRLGLRNDIT